MQSNFKKTVIITSICTVLVLALQWSMTFVSHALSNVVVNIALVLFTCFIGFRAALILSVLTPVLTYIIDFQDITFIVVPAIIVGNLLYILVYKLSPKVLEPSLPIMRYWTPVLAAALVKYLALFFGVVKLLPALIMFNGLDVERMVQLFNNMQLLTGLVGGAIGLLTVTFVRKLRGDTNEV